MKTKDTYEKYDFIVNYRPSLLFFEKALTSSPHVKTDYFSAARTMYDLFSSRCFIGPALKRLDRQIRSNPDTINTADLSAKRARQKRQYAALEASKNTITRVIEEQKLFSHRMAACYELAGVKGFAEMGQRAYWATAATVSSSPQERLEAYRSSLQESPMQPSFDAKILTAYQEELRGLSSDELRLEVLTVCTLTSQTTFYAQLYKFYSEILRKEFLEDKISPALPGASNASQISGLKPP